MNLFNSLNERIADLGLREVLSPFYNVLMEYKNEDAIKEISTLCEDNYYYINFDPSAKSNKYDVGKLIVTFDDESHAYNTSFIIHCTYTSCEHTYLPKVLIERNQFVKGFVHKNELYK